MAQQRVLIVNDDGIDGRGIQLLEQMVRRFTDDIWVVAPDEERSGASHSISINHPIRARRRDERHFAVRGSPTDCALLGIYELMGDGRRPDILLSGINDGPNLAEDVLYSGTCAAAKEGAVLGIPSVALSQMRSYGNPANWAASEAYLPDIIDRLLAMDWPPGAFVNVNVPNVAPEAITGIEVTRQGRRPAGGFVPVRREDERFVPYYWIKISPQAADPAAGTDLYATANNAVSVTPMHLDMTCESLVEDLSRRFA
ncbi:5'/3'-nucleotidase SurE [Sphingomonas sp. SUN019]|uniref:5'/3'-nucleotidase SurE n=1 Tax=Sphingomonas sp. SUN019 TaxID=2937788 RepID=UPI002164D999|nr:5'/3'-nucleotidase SurE [Sphingomonas sp. SUN019]UVO52003.1 5'/3'-nucleotidase SurE [Sphingomonas sp. SUN019]